MSMIIHGKALKVSYTLKIKIIVGRMYKIR